LLVGGLIALVLVAIVNALVSEESRRSLVILDAVGCDPRQKRAIVGLSAGLVAESAGILAAPLGFVAAAIFQSVNAVGRPIKVPWGAVGIATLLIPLLAAITAAATTKAPKPAELTKPIP
jgi:ABC-type antimicrobial peptide transport system permease subunit